MQHVGPTHQAPIQHGSLHTRCGIDWRLSGVELKQVISLVPASKGQLNKDWHGCRILCWVTTEFPIHSAASVRPNSTIMRLQVYLRLWVSPGYTLWQNTPPRSSEPSPNLLPWHPRRSRSRRRRSLGSAATADRTRWKHRRWAHTWRTPPAGLAL